MSREPLAHLIEGEYRPDIWVHGTAGDALKPRVFAKQDVTHSLD
jgi:hypothetical protein